MSLVTPTTKSINDNIIAQLEAALNQSIPLLPKSFLRVLAKALSGVFVLLYKYGGFTFLQMFVRTASFDHTTINGKEVSPLLEWGRLIGVGDPAAATNAELAINITVTNQTGNLPGGSQLVSASNGVTYITIGAVALNAATVAVTVRAVSDQVGGGGAGVIGNLDPGAVVSFANPLANVARDAAVTAQTTTGADAEDIEVYRQRIVDRFQKRPQGGAYADYEIWGEELAGILSVYPYTSDCPGQVDVYVESSSGVDGIPTGAQLQSVLDIINLDSSGLATRRPANALVNTFPITRLGFDVTVVGMVVDNLVQVRADVSTAINEYFLDREPFIAGLTIPPRKDKITRSGITCTIEDIVSPAGGVFSGVSIAQSGVTVDIFTLGAGEKAKANLVTFS